MSKKRLDSSEEPVRIEAGQKVFVHQAFKCCPYGAVISAKLHQYFEENDCAVTDHPEEAQLSVINTCGFNAFRSQLAFKAIDSIHERAPDSPMLVVGCLARIERHRVREELKARQQDAPWLMVAPDEHQNIDRVFAKPSVPFADVQTNLYHELYSRKDPRMGFYQIFVEEGCENKCTYCAIWRAKGRTKSKPIPEVIQEIKRGFELGHDEFFLIGDDLSGYGIDSGSSPIELLDKLAQVDGEPKYSAEAFEPRRFIPIVDELLPIFATGRYGWIVLPIQSGSDRILQKMKRDYRAQDVVDAAYKLKEAAPDMMISTDIIWGFEDETPEEFDSNFKVAEAFDFTCFNEYEPRPGTPVVALPAEEMARRKAIVREFKSKQGPQSAVLGMNRGSDFVYDDGNAWATENARVVTDKIETGGRDLRGGWVLDAVTMDRERVLVPIVHRETGQTLKFMLTKRDDAQPCIAHSDEYNLGLKWDEDSTCELDGKQVQALNAMVGYLGLQSDQ